LLLVPLAAAPAVAAPVGFSVEITSHTSLVSEVSDFDSSLEGCESGTVVNGADAKASFTPWGGAFSGTKEFTCAGGESGFDLRLKARFGGGGSTGTWVLTDAWGEFAGLKGSGSLVGVPVDEETIDDIFTGTFR
jgi:hypothetical protein